MATGTNHHKQAGIMLCCLLATPALQAGIIINEIDYDQPGSDSAEFIELFNPGSAAVPLDGYRLELINGTNSESYRSIMLDGLQLATQAYLVVCSDSTQVLNCDYTINSGSSWLQNGAPDGVALFDDKLLLDSLSYEGAMAGITESAPPTLADSNSETLSLARLPDGIDSNNNQLDFQLGCITPGSANIAGSGDCSQLLIDPVPVPLPASLWLFSSGLLGFSVIARRQRKQ